MNEFYSRRTISLIVDKTLNGAVLANALTTLEGTDPPSSVCAARVISTSDESVSPSRGGKGLIQYPLT